MRKRATAEESSGKNATYVIHGKAPSYDFIKDQIGVLTPEVSDGPYVYPQSQLLRQDIVGNQVGVPLVLDIGVVDVNTCSPMSDVLINIWVC
jgi:protocatechuate 3,4-dioxygenase beta subunit